MKHRARILRQAGVVVLLFTSSAVLAEETILFDFDRPGLGDRWSAVRKVTVARDSLPAAGPDGEFTPDGHAAVVSTAGGSGLFAKRGTVPRDWRKFEAVRFWIHRPDKVVDTRQAPTTLELQLYESDGKTRFWRKVKVDHQGWKRYTVPLAWMRWGNGRIPSWERIDRFGFWFRNAAELAIDTVTVSDGEEPLRFHPTANRLRRLAFPGEDDDSVTVVRRKDVLLLTNAPQLETDKLAEHLEQVSATVFRELDFLKPADEPAPIVVFATRRQYRSFPQRMAQKLNGVALAPRSDGFTIRGIATSYWDGRQGTLRPVYTHEFVHALLTPVLRLQNRSEWLHEGLAVHFQLRFHPQENFPQIVVDGLADPTAHDPLQRLCNGGPIATGRYWQAATVIETLLLDEHYKQRVPQLFSAFPREGSTRLDTHLEAVLETNAARMTADWTDYCRSQYGR